MPPTDYVNTATQATAIPARATPTPSLGDRYRLWIGLGLVEMAAIALAGWIYVLVRLDERDITDLGLISVLPPTAFAFIALVSVSFALALRMRPLMAPVLAVHVCVLVLMLYGAPAYFEDLPRFVTAWLHVGFTDAIARTGELFPFRDARFDWPGFFILAALFGSAADAESLIPILAWIPPLQMLLYLPPLALILRSATDDHRLVWLGLWFFALMNWVGQDYLSPQGFNVLLFLTVLAILLYWFRPSPARPFVPAWLTSPVRRLLRRPRTIGAPEAPGVTAQLTNRQQVGLIAIAALLIGTSVASHQLTPFAMFGGVVLLVVTQRISARGIPALILVLVVTWLMFRASTFLAGHLAGLLEDVGRPDQFATANVADRLAGSAGHVLVVQARLGFTLGIWLLAAFGGIRAILARRLDLALVLLAAAPFGLMFLQGYGGEMILRIYLFSVPFMAYHAATAFFPTLRPTGWLTTATVAVVSVALAGGMLFTRYGNEKSDIVTPGDYAAVAHALELAEPGDMIATLNTSVPAGYAEWEQHRLVSTAPVFLEGDIELIVTELDAIRRGGTAYLLVTRGQRSHAELFWGWDEDEWNARIAEFEEDMEVVYRNGDAQVLRLSDAEATQ